MENELRVTIRGNVRGKGPWQIQQEICCELKYEWKQKRWRENGYI